MSQAWLQDLEERVHEASDRLRELREENERLEARRHELEARVEDLEAAAVAEPAEGEVAWREERDEIRDRVEKLVDHLATLLDD